MFRQDGHPGLAESAPCVSHDRGHGSPWAQIEKQAAEIRQKLKRLNASFADFISAGDMLGTPLRSAYGKHEDGRRRLDRPGLELNRIQQEISVEQGVRRMSPFYRAARRLRVSAQGGGWRRSLSLPQAESRRSPKHDSSRRCFSEVHQSGLRRRV